MAAKIDWSKCSSCKACVEACPTNAIKMFEENPNPVVNEEDCIDCGQCEEACPNAAITAE